jgi:hypothetical protein
MHHYFNYKRDKTHVMLRSSYLWATLLHVWKFDMSGSASREPIGHVYFEIVVSNMAAIAVCAR